MPQFNFDEFFTKFRVPLLTLLIGAILITSGALYFKSGIFSSGTKVEVLNATTSGQVDGNEITVEIAGEVAKEGVYKLPNNSRIEDLLVMSGGFSKNADRDWTDKYLNRAAKLTDGQKIFIPQSKVLSAKAEVGDQTVSTIILSDSSELVNINTGSLKELDSLSGIGPTYAQNIVEHRPYSTIEELVSKGAINKNLFDKIKDKVSVY